MTRSTLFRDLVTLARDGKYLVSGSRISFVQDSDRLLPVGFNYLHQTPDTPHNHRKDLSTRCYFRHDLMLTFKYSRNIAISDFDFIG